MPLVTFGQGFRPSPSYSSRSFSAVSRTNTFTAARQRPIPVMNTNCKTSTGRMASQLNDGRVPLNTRSATR